jgi:hypothetical protein
MPVRLRIDGIAEFKAALRNLPTELRAEANGIVNAHADAAQAAIAAQYPEGSGRLMGLRHNLSIKSSYSAFGVTARLINRSPIAWIYENGTELRHTDLGINRGRMPAAKVFIPTVIRERRAMIADLVALVERAGLSVHGNV